MTDGRGERGLDDPLRQQFVGPRDLTVLAGAVKASEVASNRPIVLEPDV